MYHISHPTDIITNARSKTALGIALLAIYVRSVYRVAELSEGFDGKIANYEIPYMILEGAMIIIASTLLTISHPALVFGDIWRQASPKKAGKGLVSGTELEKK